MDELDADFARIIQKANRIVGKELLTSQRMEQLQSLREEDGRISLKLRQLNEQLEEQEILQASGTMELEELEEEYDTYFELLETYARDPEELQLQLQNRLENYNWRDYSNIQDRKFELEKQIETSSVMIPQLKEEFTELDTIRTQLRDRAIELMAEIDLKLQELEN